ncbi:efflux RND transporter periplasmic adaptor subunit [Sphingomonas immobilis]|uniref:Efflux RND transporter periplasmic adaptor subunit n=1 Tax=Sphingomonas immobilis TaxID=3063997 RepID=A0ABT9A1R0_9SPHN|nr:efflux RND transporter periplasmic adaptor subunit [Sphingomonas sp. CA1-15]MDO7843319.1 efflux RND transporter periplasmic adaptor subunit [Sphingomonas sp. CA1-15]
MSAAPARLAGGLAMIGVLALASCGKGAPPPPPLPQVTVAMPLQRDVIDWDEYVGRFEAIQDVDLKPRVSGTITKILFANGQRVKTGQPLFIIDPRPYQAALGQAVAQAAKANATLINARSELVRADKLLAAQAISKEEYETKQAAVRTAAADLAAAQANARNARLNIEFTTVRSPITGLVSDRRVSIGNFATEAQTSLTRVVSTNPIWFSFEGAESFYLKYLRQAKAGERGSSRNTPNPVEVQLADEKGFRWHGRMQFLDNTIDTNSGTIRAHAVIDNPDGFLTPGLFGRARLLGSGHYKAMLVPDEAVITDQARKLIYIVGKDGKIVPRPVETGPQVEGLRVVKTGLAPTDHVAIDGITNLQPGAQVKANLIKLKPRAADTAPQSTPETAPPPSDASAN